MMKLGIVGWGYWGRNYAKYLDTTIDASLDWVCDLREDMLADAKKRYPHINVTKDINDLIQAGIDAVILVTPASLHFKLARLFVENGIHLLIEKPLTNSSKDAFELEALAKKYKVKILVGHTFIYNSSVQWLKSQIDKDYFGKLYYFEFKRQSFGPIRDDVNIIWDFAPHDLSMITYFLDNQLPKSVFVKAKSYSKNDQVDIAVITLEYPRNILVNINVAWLYPVKIRNLMILGSKKMASFNDVDTLESLRIYNMSVNYPKEDSPFGASFRLGDTLIPRIIVQDPLYSELKHFVNYLKEKEEPLTSIKDGIRNVVLLELINDALKLNKEIIVKDWLKKKFGTTSI